MTANYILDIVILLGAAVIAVPLFRMVGFGAVPGFLVAGVMVGPSGLALIDNVTEISRLAELGVVLLLFIIDAAGSVIAALIVFTTLPETRPGDLEGESEESILEIPWCQGRLEAGAGGVAGCLRRIHDRQSFPPAP